MFGLIFGIAVFVAGIVLSIMSEGTLRKIAPIIGTVAAVVIIIMSCISYVPTGYTGILTTFGRVEDRTLDAGIAFHAPWQNVVTMDNREQKFTFSLEAFSRDIQQVDITGSINLNIDKSTAMNLYKDVGTNYTDVLVQPRIQEDVKIVIARYTAENLVENRQAASDAIYTLIKDELAPKGINIISFAIENLDFTDAFESAVEAKQVATQEKQRAQTEQEQKTMEAEQAAARKKIDAEAAAEVQKIEADAKAYAMQVEAEAEAEANKKISQSLTDELIEYTKINSWDGKLPTITGGSTPIINFTDVEGQE